MVHLSKKHLSNVERDKLFKQLNTTLGSLGNKQSEIFLSDFLGPEEKVMFAKRLAAIVMLYRDQSLYRVSATLKISSATAQKVKSRLDHGMYDNLLSIIQKDKIGFIDLLDAIDSILHLGGIMPHYGQTHHSEAYKRNQKKYR